MQHNPTCTARTSIRFALTALAVALCATLAPGAQAPADKKPAPGKTEETAREKTAKSVVDEKKKAEMDAKIADNLARTLDYGIQEERLLAIGTIMTLKEGPHRARLVKKLIVILKEENEADILVKVITALGELKETAAVPDIVARLDHGVEDVRTAAVYALKNMNAVSAKERLIEKLKAQDLGTASNYTDALIRTLGAFKATEVLPFAEESLKNPKTTTMFREGLVLLMGQVEAPQSRDFLMKLYTDEEEEVTIRSYAVNALSKIKDPSVAKTIKDTINTIETYPLKKRQKYHTLHIYSVAALARIGDPDAVPKLMASLKSNSAPVRIKAIQLMAELKDKRTIDILKYKMEYDQNARVRKTAREALEAMGVTVPKEKETPARERKKSPTKDTGKDGESTTTDKDDDR